MTSKVDKAIDQMLRVERLLEQGARGEFHNLSDYHRARLRGQIVRMKLILDGFLTAEENQRKKRKANAPIDSLIENVNPRVVMPASFPYWSEGMQEAWLRSNQRKKKIKA